WGIRIPVWYSVKENPDLEITFINKEGDKKFGKISEFKKESLDEIEKGLQSVRASATAKYVLSDKKPKGDYLPETDTFDTWFSSGQWPLVTLKESEFNTRFPTDTLGTLSDILKFWVSRMIMFSVYLKKEIPFKNVYLWSMVADAKGVKMSKSKGNVINPLDLVEKYGADALRMSLMYGTPAGSKVVLSDDKVRAMRNFANKVWNIGRFIELNIKDKKFKTNEIDHELSNELEELVKLTTDDLENFKLNSASERVYDFLWNKLASKYLEENKNRIIEQDQKAQMTLWVTFNTCLKLLHPFMPFVTETIYQELFSKGENDLLINSSWPK
ncbi:MAG TPA: class I tRNA ligase family protein, partial [Candidatus Saccharimonadales bacterium]|nr:class I tRNA ligase family protein [Candidatus Saccharimonadales bacterium]